MRDEIKKSLVAAGAPIDVRTEQYDIGFDAIGYERRSRFIASSLAEQTKFICGLKYMTTNALAFAENVEWAEKCGVSVRELDDDYRVDSEGRFREFVNTIVGHHASR